MTWHADVEQIERYAEGTLDDVRSASIEAHLLACEVCRRAVGSRASVETLDRVWADTVDRIDRPRRGVLERLLSLLGVPAHIARVLAVTGALQLAWFVALVAVSALAVVVAHEAPGPLPFLAFAPVVPVAGVALAFSTVSEPGAEMARATPIGGLRLLLYRTVALSLTAFLVLALSSLTVPTSSAALWVLPALALTAATLAAGTWFDPVRSAAVIGGAWITGLYLVAVPWRDDLHDLGQDPSIVLTPTVQLVALAAFVGCSVLFLSRRDHVERRAR
jgi:hypothetical protein